VNSRGVVTVEVFVIALAMECLQGGKMNGGQMINIGDAPAPSRHPGITRDAIPIMMQVIRLHEFHVSQAGKRTWMSVQRAWDEQPEQRPQLADNLRRIVRAVNGVVSQPLRPR